MSCHICNSAHSRSPCLCPTCARNRLYQLRVETARILLEKESLGQQIRATVDPEPVKRSSPREDPTVERDHECSHSWNLQTTFEQQAAASFRTDELSKHISILRKEIQARKTDIAERRASLTRKRSDAESAQYQLAERETTALTGIQNTNKRAEHIWHSLHSKTAEARIFLCREAAHLYGLRQKPPRKGSSRQRYVLGANLVVDLRDMNGARAAEISASFANVAQLLVLVSHYLSLRLPAEITLPHRDYATPTIFAPSSSYDLREMADKVSPSHPSTPSPVASRTAESRVQSRPRPLSIDKSLQILAKEDPGTYALFLEGAALLAWDVAWLCRTQGININSDSWEEICDIGKSMYQFLVAPPAQPASLTRAFASRDMQTKVKHTKDSPQTTIQRRKSFPILGHYSHATVHSFLAASEGSEFVRTWKLPTPTKIADKLKATLLGEMASAEWELLEEVEWDDGTAKTHQSPIVQDLDIPNSTAEPARTNDGRKNSQTAQGADDARRSKGNSGWMKLNSR
ncbi:UV radiation resistance protein and autophagy-related subunit 14-domain-containing protein [Penicillium argentinense]|uniref:Autophagy-related protein 14 n=1 Tax=Penicillium argentinense TaxID=1131581 RepID=A0A9W9FFF2_9EURO|nr:UV radiation resistance protein and autophagy-related subunit 14-domain-containing protein [Penicillium argentinense]KAJ5099109.1 UV radiation resistance protein and autophagy-related subunit 14-domain-containing protein [Penicillium argentinense]